ncbi:hypothetical protein F0562_020526 [Nyssa sinensis]|uniref:Uncharacterized protein n=1 Tax=Nyssa sinensis TaxID=561372 RepID=A0A5J5BSD1_9ASTE|nr:hypothetical protein F0562_020526 [Nyssa sinensis]
MASLQSFPKTYDHDILEGDLYPSPSEELDIWVPQTSLQLSRLPLYLPQTGVINGLKVSEKASNVMKVSSKWSSTHEDGFTVPQISPPSPKGSRQFW